MQKPKLKHIWSIISEGSAIDAETNTLSIFNIIEDLSFQFSGNEMPSEAMVPVKYHLVTFWEKEGEGEMSAAIKAELYDPSGEKIFETPNQPIEIGRSLARLRSRTGFNSMKVTTPGKYRFEMLIDQGEGMEKAGGVSFSVKINK